MQQESQTHASREEARAAFIESLRKAIDDGTYQINSRAIAEKLLDRLFPETGEIH